MSDKTPILVKPKRCDFCGKEERDVPMIVSSPTAGICSGCVVTVSQLMERYFKENEKGKG